MTLKERFQNPNCGDQLKLRLFSFNSNVKTNVHQIDRVEIYNLDPYEVTEENRLGKRLVETVSPSQVVNTAPGEYSLDLSLISPAYTIGKYIDVWYVKFEDSEPCTESAVENYFEIMPSLWFTSTSPSIYDFSFYFKPNKITKGSKRYVIIEIVPNVPKGDEIERYYTNLAIISDLKIYIEKYCSKCLPEEQDLRMVVDGDVVSLREKRFAYYFLDTTEMDAGIYNIWFELNYAENTFISDKNQISIYQ